MKTNDSKSHKPYGTINLCLAQQLYRSGEVSAVMLHLYIGARRHLKDSQWEFNIPDISLQTGVDRRVLGKHVKRMVSEGVFLCAGRTSKGATKYTLNQKAYDSRFSEFEASPCALPSNQGSEGCSLNAHTSNEQSDVHSMLSPCASNEHLDVHSVQGGCALDEHHDVHPMYTKNKEEESEEEKRQKDRQEEAKICLPSSLPTSLFPKGKEVALNPFSQPIFAGGQDRPARRKYEKEHPPEELLPRTSIGDKKSELSCSGEIMQGDPALVLPNSKPFKYTIGEDTHFISFYEHEENATLSSAEKIRVLKQSLRSFTTLGDVKVPRVVVMTVNGKSFELAHQFFDVNPSIPVSSLLKILWECNRVAYENPAKESGFKPCFMHRAAAESLTYFIKNLEALNCTIPEELRLPDMTQFLAASPSTK